MGLFYYSPPINGAVEKTTKEIKNTGITSMPNNTFKTTEVSAAAIVIEITHANTISLSDWFILYLDSLKHQLFYTPSRYAPDRSCSKIHSL